MQFLSRAKGTNQIMERSFPFWGPTEQFGLEQARIQNRMPKPNRSYWTHLLIHAYLVETPDGATSKPIEIKERKI